MPLPNPPDTARFVITAMRTTDIDPLPEIMWSGDDLVEARAKLIQSRSLLPAYGEWLLNGEPV